MGEEQGKDKKAKEAKYHKSYFDVLGICCTSEVPLIEKILKPLNGVDKVTVVVPSKTVIVVHDSNLISQQDILKALNQARLEATIRTHGSASVAKKWPSPYILACGMLLLVSLFKHFFHPLRWFAIAAVSVGIVPIILRGVAAVRRLTLDINILLLIAVAGAIALRDYSEAAFIVFLFTVAEWLETRASHKATAGMSSLMSMAPQKAVLAETGQAVGVDDVKINTIIAVKAGEVIPIDGIVVDGQSEVDERSLTGESFPVAKQADSPVWAGTLNLDGYISVRTTALAENSAVARMARLVEDAQSSRSSTQSLIDSCTKYYTPAVVIAAAVISIIPLITKVKHPRSWFQLALVLLVSACPCALVLSTPVATFCALLKAARVGLLIKGGDVLESLAKIKVAAFDKTGTITRGEFTIVEFQSTSSKVAQDTLLYWVSSIESKSSHPMAAAFVEHARSRSIEPKPEHVKEFCIYPGEGIYGEIQGRNIYIGNQRIAARASSETVSSSERHEGVTFGYVFLDMVQIGRYALSDTCRAGAAEAIKELKSLGIKTVMLTGDSKEAAMHAQIQLNHGMEEVHAELLPEDKVKLIGELESREGYTAMVGDGMNDAPALALASVGISMGISGSAVAMETSHITLMSNDIGKIVKAIRLARKTRYTVITNIIFSMVTKIAILALAFAGHPLLWAAVLADVGTCLLVILNSMMLLQSKTSSGKKCCGSSHKTCSGKPKGARGSSSTCAQSGCHDHRKANDETVHQDHHAESPCRSRCGHARGVKEEIMHDTCMDQDRQAESPCHSRSQCGHAQGLEEEAVHSHCHSHCGQAMHLQAAVSTSTKEHLVSIADACQTNVGSHSQKHGREQDITSQKNAGCCGSDANKCGKEEGCSSSQGAITGRREIGGCCRSYRKACGKKDSCCASERIQLPEIITE
ncbi:putative inactive cadmium/zinc-transporting ATPase HMA3 isoform X2 [Curcuma longa]